VNAPNRRASTPSSSWTSVAFGRGRRVLPQIRIVPTFSGALRLGTTRRSWVVSRPCQRFRELAEAGLRAEQRGWASKMMLVQPSRGSGHSRRPLFQARWLTHLACFRTPRRPRALRSRRSAREPRGLHRIQGRPVNGRLFPGATLIFRLTVFVSRVSSTEILRKTVRAFTDVPRATPAQTFVSGPLSEQSDVCAETPIGRDRPIGTKCTSSPIVCRS